MLFAMGESGIDAMGMPAFQWLEKLVPGIRVTDLGVMGNDTIIELTPTGRRAAGSTTDTAERFEYKFVDNWMGWRYISVPWSSFTRRADWQPAGAPNDGFTLTQVWGFNFAPISGSGYFQLDQVQFMK